MFNGLDRERRAALMRVLESSRRSQMPWVLAAHRVQDLPDSLTHVLMLNQGRVRYSGRRSRALLERMFEVPARGNLRVRSKVASRAKPQPRPLVARCFRAPR